MWQLYLNIFRMELMMNDYKIGLTTGILLTISSFLFISARTVNVKQTKFEHIVVKSITLKDDSGITNIYPGTIQIKDRRFSEVVIKPDLLSIDNYRNSSNNELSLTNEKLVFKKNGQVKYFLPPHRLN